MSKIVDFDIEEGANFLRQKLQERIENILSNTEKIPYTDDSIDILMKQIEDKLKYGVETGAFKSYKLKRPPLVKDISDQDKAARILPGIEFEITTTGKINI